MVSGESVELEIIMLKNDKCSLVGNCRIAVNVDVFKGEEAVGGGFAIDSKQDWNDFLTLYVDKNQSILSVTCEIVSVDKKGQEEPVQVCLYMGVEE